MRIVLEGWRLLNFFLLIVVLTIYNVHHIMILLSSWSVTNNNHLLYNNGGNLKKHFSNTRNADGFHREPHIFGHLHFMKTGGTTLNGELALNYERVCGHKGWSYDAFLVNKRANSSTDWHQVEDSFTFAEHSYLHKNNRRRNFTPKEKLLSLETDNSTTRRLIQKGNETDHRSHRRRKVKKYNRGRVPAIISTEIGYHDCDYISEERPWGFWQNLTESFVNIPIELHVPCRDPIDHLMSQCNNSGRQFNCSSIDLLAETKSCLSAMNRFNNTLLTVENMSVKCYAYELQFTDYMNYITPKLQLKRIQSDYAHRDSNLPRNRAKECIWEETQTMEKVKELLTTMDYYSFCDACIGSSDDLLV